MKTNDLIDMLASGDTRPPTPSTGKIAVTLLSGLLTSIAATVIFLGVRPDLLQASALPLFWMKVALVMVLAVIGWIVTTRLSAPGRGAGSIAAVLALPIMLVWVVAAVSLADAPVQQRSAMFWGQTWRTCPLLIAALSLPMLAGMISLLRERAPTRLRLAGAAAGLTAGATAATVYCLHCPELAAPFVGFWYLLGIAIPTAAGAALGPRLLAW